MIISVMMITFVLQIYLRMKPLQKLIMKLMMKTLMCMMALLPVLHIMTKVWKVFFLLTFFSKEDEHEDEYKYSLDHDTSDEDSLMSDKDVDEDSWTFMENPVYDINKEEK